MHELGGQSILQISGMFEEHFHILSALVGKGSGSYFRLSSNL